MRAKPELSTPPGIQSDSPSLLAILRGATSDLHQRLHEHPLIVELLNKPSLDAYESVLSAFLRFYRPVEQLIVDSCCRFGIADQYSRSVRTDWLIADLEFLVHDRRRIDRFTYDQIPLPMNSLAELIGCLYVVKGSSLGGLSIAQSISSQLSVERCCRFFTCDGADIQKDWMVFQTSCMQAALDEESTNAAIQTARETFAAISACLTLSFQARFS